MERSLLCKVTIARDRSTYFCFVVVALQSSSTVSSIDFSICFESDFTSFRSWMVYGRASIDVFSTFQRCGGNHLNKFKDAVVSVENASLRSTNLFLVNSVIVYLPLWLAVSPRSSRRPSCDVRMENEDIQKIGRSTIRRSHVFSPTTCLNLSNLVWKSEVSDVTGVVQVGTPSVARRQCWIASAQDSIPIPSPFMFSKTIPHTSNLAHCPL